MLERCPGCDLKFERDEGSRLGSAMINYAAVGGALVIYIVIALMATVPEVPVVPIVLGAFVLVFVVAAIGFPFAKTLWAALELALRGSPDAD